MPSGCRKSYGTFVTFFVANVQFLQWREHFFGGGVEPFFKAPVCLVAINLLLYLPLAFKRADKKLCICWFYGRVRSQVGVCVPGPAGSWVSELRGARRPFGSE